MMTTVFNVENMKCGGCSANVENVLNELPNIESVSVNLEQKTVTIEGNINNEAIAKIISDAGYPAKLS